MRAHLVGSPCILHLACGGLTFLRGGPLCAAGLGKVPSLLLLPRHPTQKRETQTFRKLSATSSQKYLLIRVILEYAGCGADGRFAHFATVDGTRCIFSFPLFFIYPIDY